MTDVTTEQLLQGFAKATTNYIADERSTSASCGALGEHTRTMLDELGLEKEFTEALVGQTKDIMTQILDDLMEHINEAD